MHRDYKRTELRAIKGIQGKFQALSIPLYRARPPGREFMDMFRIIAGGLLGKRRVSRSVYARDQVLFRQESSKHSKAHPTNPGLHRASEQSVQSRSVTISIEGCFAVEFLGSCVNFAFPRQPIFLKLTVLLARLPQASRN